MRCSRLRGADERGRITFEHTLAPQVAAEGANRGQLPRRRRFRVTPLVEIAEPGAGAEMIEVRRFELGDAAAGVRGEEDEILREIAVVGAHGVRRRVLVQPEILEKGFEVVSNQSARSLSARSEIARFLSFLLFTRRSSGGIRPNAMFDGTVVFRIGVGGVIGQRADRRRAGRDRRFLAKRERRSLASRDQPRRGGFDVALDAGHLPGEEQVGAHPRLPGLAQHGRRVHVGVAVDHPVARELGVLQARDHLEHARLLAPLHLRLEPDQAEVVARRCCPAGAVRSRRLRDQCADR